MMTNDRSEKVPTIVMMNSLYGEGGGGRLSIRQQHLLLGAGALATTAGLQCG